MRKAKDMASESFEPLVSVVIPTYNRPHLVRRAIDSVLNQTYRKLQILVVIDGGDSITLEDLLPLADDRLRVLAMAENGGPSGARNYGVKLCTAEWVAFLDDDDEWFPEKIEKQIAVVRHDSSINFIATRLVEYSRLEHRPRPADFPRAGERMSDYWYSRAGFLIPSTFLVKRSLMLELPFRLECRGNEDVDWLLRADLKRVISPFWLNEILVIYHSEHIEFRLSTHSKWKERYDWLRSNLSLFSAESIPFYFGRICIPEAQKSEAAIRNCIFLIREAFRLGRVTMRSLLYLFVVSLTSRSGRAKLRRRLPFLEDISMGVVAHLRGLRR